MVAAHQALEHCVTGVAKEKSLQCAVFASLLLTQLAGTGGEKPRAKERRRLVDSLPLDKKRIPEEAKKPEYWSSFQEDELPDRSQ